MSAAIFKNEAVFDPDYIPDVLLFREKQIRELSACLQPAVEGLSPLNAFCVGVPSTGKTSTIMHTTEPLENYNVAVSYIRCLRHTDPFKICAKIFEDVCGHEAPQSGVSKTRLMNKVWNTLEDRNMPLVVVLDDLSFLKPSYASEIICELLRAPDEFRVRVGIVAVSIDPSYPILLDPFAGAVFHYVEISYPAYSYSEIKEILRWRVDHGLEEDAITDDAFERVVEITHRAGDLRYGIHLIRAAGRIAQLRGKGKIEVEDIERAHIGEPLMYLSKMLAALNSDERAVLRLIYECDEEVRSGELYRAIHQEVKMTYRRFFNILEKLERLRLIDVVVERKRGLTRVIYKRYDQDVMLEALRGAVL